MEVDFREQYDTNIIALKQAGEYDFTIEFQPTYVITEEDVFIGVTTDQGRKKLLDA